MDLFDRTETVKAVHNNLQEHQQSVGPSRRSPRVSRILRRIKKESGTNQWQVPDPIEEASLTAAKLPERVRAQGSADRTSACVGCSAQTGCGVFMHVFIFIFKNV